MKTIRNFSVLLLITALLVSCSSLTVNTDYDKSVDFSKYKSFSFYELTDKSGSVSELNKKRIVNAVKNEMTKKGFVESAENPDVLINITTILADKKSITANTNYYNYGGYYRPYYWGGGYAGATTSYDVYEYKDGSVIIDVIDASNKQLIWQGIGNKEIDSPSKNPEKTINEAVAKIMENFPPKAKK
ncbi:hypothetical protein FLJC2902T_30050 [Flavobacterium limnosediminis JC2902]|uniref:DUF4136 domain-containing protein n=1 Tax=Flavobacterium limnosediminis JC2902 TaxID=1341181 RepID=V6SN32_9FLAO|nr:DUF4136 domain-containing protein [Flavobacterium limnosediminis]ESU25815.1 hypothetical protein FLJC2902T_30050 [Flavobacterium limnosediminis JC2902]